MAEFPVVFCGFFFFPRKSEQAMIEEIEMFLGCFPPYEIGYCFICRTRFLDLPRIVSGHLSSAEASPLKHVQIFGLYKCVVYFTGGTTSTGLLKRKRSWANSGAPVGGRISFPTSVTAIAIHSLLGGQEGRVRTLEGG